MQAAAARSHRDTRQHKGAGGQGGAVQPAQEGEEAQQAQHAHDLVGRGDAAAQVHPRMLYQVQHHDLHPDSIVRGCDSREIPFLAAQSSRERLDVV